MDYTLEFEENSKGTVCLPPGNSIYSFSMGMPWSDLHYQLTVALNFLDIDIQHHNNGDYQ